jgi:hypothetical protein
MSTDFHTLGTSAQDRALDSRPALRGFAVVAWWGFLGATLALLAMLYAEADLIGRDLRGLSEAFFAAWLLATLPAGLAYYLAKAPHGR